MFFMNKIVSFFKSNPWAVVVDHSGFLVLDMVLKMLTFLSTGKTCKNHDKR